MPGLSLQWYRDFFGNERWYGALILSVKLAVTVTILSTILGTMAALGLSRARLPLRIVILGILLLPLIVPVIIVAVGVFMFYGYFGLIGTFTGLVLAHTALAAPFVVITVLSTLTNFDWALPRAAAGTRRLTLLRISEGHSSADPAGRGYRRALRLRDLLRRGRGGAVPVKRRAADLAEADVQRHSRDDQPDDYRRSYIAGGVVNFPSYRSRKLAATLSTPSRSSVIVCARAGITSCAVFDRARVWPQEHQGP